MVEPHIFANKQPVFATQTNIQSASSVALPPTSYVPPFLPSKAQNIDNTPVQDQAVSMRDLVEVLKLNRKGPLPEW